MQNITVHDSILFHSLKMQNCYCSQQNTNILNVCKIKKKTVKNSIHEITEYVLI